MNNKLIESRSQIIREVLAYCFSKKPRDAFTIFLCGGSGKEASNFRFSLGKAIEETQSQAYIFSVFYPETLFSEFLYGSAKHNLMALEQILAENVSAIVLPLQSPGTYAELGVFVSNEQLRPKLIVINSKKYNRVRSFINDGPIAHLEKGNIIYNEMSYDKATIDVLKYEIRKKTRQIKQQNKQDKTLFDIRFALCVLIYVFDPISKTDLRNYVIASNILKQDEIRLLDPALGILGTNGYIHSTPKLEYRIDSRSFHQFLRKTGYNREEVYQFQLYVDELRLRALNYRLRKESG